jgi:hypothetical protein
MIQYEFDYYYDYHYYYSIDMQGWAALVDTITVL